jgi:hypothetical protein
LFWFHFLILFLLGIVLTISLALPHLLNSFASSYDDNNNNAIFATLKAPMSSKYGKKYFDRVNICYFVSLDFSSFFFFTILSCPSSYSYRALILSVLVARMPHPFVASTDLEVLRLNERCGNNNKKKRKRKGFEGQSRTIQEHLT